MDFGCLRPWLSVLAVGFVLSFAAAAKTTVSCSNMACLGQPFEITCKISGNIESGISWTGTNKTLEVVTCNKNSDCVSSHANYEGTVEKLRIKKFGEEDMGPWLCRDGNRQLTRMCNINISMVAPEGKLKASCKVAPNDEQRLVGSCTGITSLGFPNVTVKGEVPEYFGYGKAMCSLEGPASQCVIPIDRTDTASCPHGNPATVHPTTESPGNPATVLPAAESPDQETTTFKSGKTAEDTTPCGTHTDLHPFSFGVGMGTGAAVMLCIASFCIAVCQCRSKIYCLPGTRTKEKSNSVNCVEEGHFRDFATEIVTSEGDDCDFPRKSNDIFPGRSAASHSGYDYLGSSGTSNI